MSIVIEACSLCRWQTILTFRYHGGVPVEHPVCPSCGGQLKWSYDFDADEVSGTPEAMEANVGIDEDGFPVDQSPGFVRLNAIIESALETETGSPVRITNHRGMVDVELRACADHVQGFSGAKLVAHVGHAVNAVALVELLERINMTLESGNVVISTSAYGHPMKAFELATFGADVSLLYQDFIPEADFTTGDWIRRWKEGSDIAARLAAEFAKTARVAPTTPDEPGHYNSNFIDVNFDDYAISHDVELEDVSTIIEPLMSTGPEVSDIVHRLNDFLSQVGAGGDDFAQETWAFSLGSAHIHVSLIERDERALVLYQSPILTGIALGNSGDVQRPAELLTSLNSQTTFGRCLLLPSDDGATASIMLEKTLLALDVDISEFVYTLVAFAEQADLMDNILQDDLGGTLADERPGAAESAEQPLEDLVVRLVNHGVPGHRRLGVDEGHKQVLHMLEEVKLRADEDDHGTMWFNYGSAQFGAMVWQDERATYLTLRAAVLQDVQTRTGLPEALNEINRNIHLGAFALTHDGTQVQLVETLIADDLAVEELAYALITIGQMADSYDDGLQARFGGRMGNEAP